MHIAITNPDSRNGGSIYTLRSLYRDARALARIRDLRYVRHWVEFSTDGHARLAVELKGKDFGDIARMAL